jgi:hypothetical protein
MANHDIPPIGTRFALRDRDDGTVLCIVRTDRRSYAHEFRAPGGDWHCPVRASASLAEALERVDWLAQADTEKWRNVCWNAYLSPLREMERANG